MNAHPYDRSSSGDARSTAASDEILVPGTVFARYRIVRELGRGGMGAVFEAQHLELQKTVAVKAILPSGIQSPEIRHRLVREGEAAARIRHPHIVDIYDVGTESGIPYLVMEFLSGEDLNQFLRARAAPLSPTEAADILMPVCAGLSAAHEQGVIHRDLKPANIFLARGAHGEIVPKVLDFGIAKALDTAPDKELTSTGALMGTPFYMSPEQAKGDKHLDARSDLYSLGVILYQCLTSHRPFEGQSLYSILAQIVGGSFVLPSQINPQLPAVLESIILRAMATAPEHRYPFAADLGRALMPFASDRARAVWQPVFGAQQESIPSEAQPAAPASPHAPLATAGAARTPDSGSRPAAALASPTETLDGSELLIPPRSYGPTVAVVAGLLLTIALLFYLSQRGAQVPVVRALPTIVPEQQTLNPARPVELQPTFQVDVKTEPEGAKIVLDGLQAPNPLSIELPKDGTRHVLRVEGDGFIPMELVFTDAAPSALVRLQPIPVPKKTKRSRRGPRRTPKPTPPAQPEPTFKRGTNDALIID